MDEIELSDYPWRFEAAPNSEPECLIGWIVPHGQHVEDDPNVAYVENVGSADLAVLLTGPELLDALEAMLPEFAESLNSGKPVGHTVGSMNRALAAIKLAEAAIAKAKGS